MLGAPRSGGCIHLVVDQLQRCLPLTIPGVLRAPLPCHVQLERRWQEDLPELLVVLALDVPTAVLDLLVLASRKI